MAYISCTVTKNKINVYKSTNTKKKVGTIKNGANFKAEDAGQHGNYNWYKVVSVDPGKSTGTVVAKYVKHTGSNFSIEGQSDSANTQYDGTGAATDALSEDDAANLTIDEAFFKPYTDGSSESEYVKMLSGGLSIENIRGVLGIPHQFTALTDARLTGSVSDNQAIGRTYAEKFLKRMPLLLMTPGVPKFMTGFDEDNKKNVLQALFGAVTGYSSLDQLVSGGGGKYYTLKFAYSEYFQFVNPMLRAAAYYLNIEDKTVNGTKLGNFNWLYDGESPGVASNRSFGRFLGPYAGSVAFYANCGNDISESLGNDTGQSQLASSLNSISDTGRELNFLIGNFGSAVDSVKLTSLAGADDLGQLDGVKSAIESIMGGHSNIFSNILNKSTTILAGGRLVFPEIWTDSSFGRSYSCNMKLTSPSGDAFSVYMNILVPLYHLLGFTLPRHAKDAGQAYFSPFLVRAYSQSMFNIDMGIISSLSITKGGEGEWTSAGLFTSLDVSFEIKDLYNVLFMSTGTADSTGGTIVSNITELDYIANTCGVNINDQEIMRTAKIAASIGWGATVDKYTTGILAGITQSINERLEGIFGVFS